MNGWDAQGAPGGFEGLAFESAKAEPTATHAPAMSPALMRSDLLCRCLAGAIAAPTGWAAGAPLLWALLRQLPPRAPNLDSAVALNHFGSTELAAQASERLVIEH